jgi:glycerate-2-kinase
MDKRKQEGMELAIKIIEARLPLYTDIGQINALRECISSIRGAALKEQEKVG